jgi:hypothetical protein
MSSRAYAMNGGREANGVSGANDHPSLVSPLLWRLVVNRMHYDPRESILRANQ